MYKISELIGKQSITLLDASGKGVVAAAYFDKSLSKCKYFLLLSDEEDGRFFVPYKNLKSTLNDAMVIDSCLSITDKQPAGVVSSPINLPAFNQDGKSLGVIRDIVLDGETVISFITDCGEINPATMLSRSGSLLVFNDSGEPLKLKKPARRKKTDEPEKNQPNARSGENIISSSLKLIRKNNSEEVNVSKNEKNNENGRIETPLKISPLDNILSPTSAINKYYFLLGRRLQRSIYTEKGALIAKENDLISEDIIQKAKDGNKLVAVALHSI